MTALLVANSRLHVAECGDSALRVSVQAPTPDEAWKIAHAVATSLETQKPPGLQCVVPTYDAVLIEFDCETTTHAALTATLANVAGALAEVGPRKPCTFTIPVVYGGDLGPDLSATARYLNVDESEVVALHSAQPLTMRCFGSPGGAPMLDGPRFPRPIPRLTSPRPHVPAGAVAVAGRQAVVSARPAPGGWHVLGTTPVTLVDVTRDPICAYWPGDQFRFVPIAESEFDHHIGLVA